MYEPVRKLLSEQGFIVRGEVKDCDIAALKDGCLWVVEMKLYANITLIYQAIERQSATDWVFVAIPRPRRARDGNFLSLQKLLKKLNLGLITVALDSPVKQAEILLFPGPGGRNKNNKKSNAIRKELLGRTTDTPGGTTKTSVNTAYRERCVQIACLLAAKGRLRAKDLVELGCEKDATFILQNNFFGWFDKVSRGVYEISDAGRGYLSNNEASSLVAYYRMKARDIF